MTKQQKEAYDKAVKAMMRFGLTRREAEQELRNQAFTPDGMVGEDGTIYYDC